MEQKKFDSNSILGFVLISGILIWMLYLNKPTEEEIQAEQARKEAEALEAEKQTNEDIQFSDATKQLTSVNTHDSLAFEQLRNRLGSFAYSETTDAAQAHETILENDVLFFKGQQQRWLYYRSTIKKSHPIRFHSDIFNSQ